MISIFRKNLFINSIFLLPYIFILRLKFILEPESLPGVNSVGYLSQKLTSWLESPLNLTIVSIIVCFINALIINRITIKNHLYKENNLLPGMFYALFSSMLLAFIPANEVHFASFFILLALQSIFNSYNNVKSADDIFLSGFYLGLATLFYFPCFLLIIFGYFGFNIMRSFNAKEVLQYILGWMAPFYLVMIYQYYVGETQMVLPYYFWGKIGFSQFFSGTSITQLLILALVFILVIIFLFNYGNYMGKKVIVAQKRISIMFLIMLFFLIMVLVYRWVYLSHLLVLCIPASVFLTFNILDMKNRIWPEIIHLLLVLTLVINHLELIKLN